jgi:hypothetical protein
MSQLNCLLTANPLNLYANTSYFSASIDKKAFSPDVLLIVGKETVRDISPLCLKAFHTDAGAFHLTLQH